MNKLIIFITLLFLTHTTHAETCPSPQSLQINNLQEWHALDINSASPLSDKRLQEFEKNVTHFSLAEWMEDAPEGEAHCYYEGDHDYLGVFLAKHNLAPDKTATAWQQLGASTFQCQTGITQCTYNLKVAILRDR